MSYKIILVESKIPEDKRYNREYLEDYELEISVIGSYCSLSDILSCNNPIVNNFIADLNGMGWVNTKDIEDKEKRVKALKEYFIMDTKGWDEPEKIDIDDLYDSQLKGLASGRFHIVQKISNNCLKGESKKEYDKAVKRHKKAESRKKEADKNRKAKAKQKKLDNAKKLLEKEGIKIK